MAIKYYPNRIFKKVEPGIDRVMAKRGPVTIFGHQELNAGDLNQTISANTGWQLEVVSLDFNNSAAKSYSLSIKSGRKILTDLNDYFWIGSSLTASQRIVLSPGFYTGTELAAQIKAKLDANTAFLAAGIVFTVTYNNATGVFFISPSVGTIRYLDVETSQTLRYRDSIAGHLFGFNATTAFLNNVSSDTTVSGLDGEAYILSESASADTARYHDNIHILSIDQAAVLYANSSGSSIGVNYAVTYEEIV